MIYGKFDRSQGGHYYWDSAQNIWWTWDTPEMIARKFPAIMEEKQLGGSFAWALGEDGDQFIHLQALNAEMKKFQNRPHDTKLGVGGVSLGKSDEL